jgi:hypothetical protein
MSVTQLDLFDAVVPAALPIVPGPAQRKRDQRRQVNPVTKPITTNCRPRRAPAAVSDPGWGAVFQLLPSEWEQAEREHGHLAPKAK